MRDMITVLFFDNEHCLFVVNNVAIGIFIVAWIIIIIAITIIISIIVMTIIIWIKNIFRFFSSTIILPISTFSFAFTWKNIIAILLLIIVIVNIV